MATVCACARRAWARRAARRDAVASQAAADDAQARLAQALSGRLSLAKGRVAAARRWPASSSQPLLTLGQAEATQTMTITQTGS